MASFTLAITLGGTPIDFTGEVSAGKEEGTAGIARFRLVPATGVAFIPEALIKQPVVIAYNGITAWTGSVQTATPDISAGVIDVTASDGLQAHFENLLQAQILAAIPGGNWHRAVFGDRQSGWEQAEDVLDTTLSEVHMDRLGNLAVGDWTTLSGASYTDADVVYLSETADLAPGETLINKVVITTEYRFTRLKQRHYLWQWSWGALDFCTWKNNLFTLLSRSMIEESALGTGWAPHGGVAMMTLPNAVTGTPCGDWTPDPERQKIDVINASWTGFRRWAQLVREKYTLVVQAANSIARYGERQSEDGAT